MTKQYRLRSGTADIADVRDYPAFREHRDATDTLPNGRQVPRFVFHALDGYSDELELRGRAVTVNKAQEEELLTSPGLLFEEVAEDQSTFAARVRVAAGLPVDEVSAVAVLETRSADAVRNDVRRELAALKAQGAQPSQAASVEQVAPMAAATDAPKAAAPQADAPKAATATPDKPNAARQQSSKAR